jgi:hypothetical protein
MAALGGLGQVGGDVGVVGGGAAVTVSLLSELAALRRERAAQRKSERRFFFGSVEAVIEERVGASVGSRVFDGAVWLCEHLAELSRLGEFPLDSNVLELGSGTALCAVVCAKLFADVRVVASDREMQRDLIEANLAANATPSERARFVALDWTDGDAVTALLAVERRGGFSHVLMSDVVPSDRTVFPALVSTLCRVTSPGSVVLFTQTSAAEDDAHPQLGLLRRSADFERCNTPLQDFLAMVDAHGFKVECLARNRLWQFTRRSGAWLSTDGGFASRN